MSCADLCPPTGQDRDGLLLVWWTVLLPFGPLVGGQEAALSIFEETFAPSRAAA